jgi:hypothetical protein
MAISRPWITTPESISGQAIAWALARRIASSIPRNRMDCAAAVAGPLRMGAAPGKVPGVTADPIPVHSREFPGVCPTAQ